MGVDRIGEVGNRASEGQDAGVYGAGFTAGFLAWNGPRGFNMATTKSAVLHIS